METEFVCLHFNLIAALKSVPSLSGQPSLTLDKMDSQIENDNGKPYLWMMKLAFSDSAYGRSYIKWIPIMKMTVKNLLTRNDKIKDNFSYRLI